MMGNEEQAGVNSVMRYTVCLGNSSGVTTKREICRGMDEVSTLMLSTDWSVATVVREVSRTPTTLSVKTTSF